MIAIRGIAGVLLAGWLADKLASTDTDVEAGIDAYEAGDHDGALGHYDRAVERLGERPEISFDRGLALLAKGELEPARAAFERASEADDTEVRASALYELGNLALDAEDFDGAIARYIDCLKARPDHENAKWNLELALLRKQKKDEEEEKKDEDQGSDSGGESGGSEEGGSEEGGSEEGGSEEGGSEEGGESGDQKQDDQKQDDQKQDDQKQDDQKQDDQKQDDQKQDDQKQDDQKQDDQKQDDQKQDDQKQDDQKQDDQKQAPPEPTPAERFDLQRALDQLDEQDQYPLDRARVRTAPARKDW